VAYHKWQVCFSFIYSQHPFSQKFLKGVSENFCVGKNSMPKRGKGERETYLSIFATMVWDVKVSYKVKGYKLHIKKCVIEKNVLIVKQAMVSKPIFVKLV